MMMTTVDEAPLLQEQVEVGGAGNADNAGNAAEAGEDEGKFARPMDQYIVSHSLQPSTHTIILSFPVSPRINPEEEHVGAVDVDIGGAAEEDDGLRFEVSMINSTIGIQSLCTLPVHESSKRGTHTRIVRHTILYSPYSDEYSSKLFRLHDRSSSHFQYNKVVVARNTSFVEDIITGPINIRRALPDLARNSISCIALSAIMLVFVSTKVCSD
jgi:hypothetical protein